MMQVPNIFIDPIKSKQVELSYILSGLYYQTKGLYHSAKKLWKKAKEKGYEFDITDVKKWLSRQAIWQIHSLPPKYIPQASFNKITRPNEYHQADILYMPHDVMKGHNYKYCLNIVDVASRYKASIPLYNRSSKSVARAFLKVYGSKNSPLIWPKVLQVDGGSEFKDETVRLLSKRGVRIRIGKSKKHQAIVERFNRTLAKRLFRIQDAHELRKKVVYTAWVKNLQDIVDDINNSITRLLGISPAEAIQKDEVIALPSKIRKNRLVGTDEECLPADALVRYLLDKSDLKGGIRRATDPIWSDKIFTIESITVICGQPVMYRLIDGPKKIFVREELLVVPSDTELPPASFIG
jgi:transposase InsO family protein